MTKRTTLKWISFLFFPDPWATAGLVTLEQNSELGIDLRLLLGGGLVGGLVGRKFGVETGENLHLERYWFGFNIKWPNKNHERNM